MIHSTLANLLSIDTSKLGRNKPQQQSGTAIAQRGQATNKGQIATECSETNRSIGSKICKAKQS